MATICGEGADARWREDDEDEELNWGRSGLLAFVEGDMKEGMVGLYRKEERGRDLRS